jgi:hypothetical protein
MATYWTEFLENAGSPDMAVDGSVTPVEFESATIATGELIRATRLIVTIQGGANTRPDNYGSIAALGNGCILEFWDHNGVKQTLTAEAVKTNGEWRSYCHDLEPYESATASILSVRWTFTKGGTDILMRPGAFFRFTVRDDLSTLALHRCCLQGSKQDDESVKNI